MLSAYEQESKIRRLELELEEVRRAAATTASPAQTASAGGGTTTTGTQPVIINLIRNGDLNHSVNSWFEGAPSGTNKEAEAANVYTHPPMNAVRVADGQIALAAPTVLKCVTSAPFLAGDVGARLVIPNVGTGGDDLATTIASFVSSAEVTLTDAAVITTDKFNLTVRFRLRKLGKTNSKTTVGAVNDALKSPAHTDYAANINDPDWDRTNGTIRLGSTNTIDCPFGYYQFVPNDGAGNGTNFIPLHPLYPGRTIFARLNLARASRFVKPKGTLYFGIYNNHDAVLDFAAGTAFALSGATVGTPTAPVLAQYLVIIETDQNYSIVSKILSLPMSPNDAGFSDDVFNTVSWRAFAGALRYKIYRKLGTGNVFLLEGDSPTANYTDKNPAQRLDTGTTAFPNPANIRDAVSAYVSTSVGDLDNLPVNGQADWTSQKVVIPFPASINLGKFSDPFLRIGLTAPCSIEMTDAVSDGTTLINSAVAQFTAAMVGKRFTLTDPTAAATRILTGTVAAFVSPTQINLSANPNWTSVGNTLEIEESAPHGILIDLIGAALLPGEWAAHTEDLNGRPQEAASNPNGSTQGGVTGGGATGGGSGEDEGGQSYPGNHHIQRDENIF